MSYEVHTTVEADASPEAVWRVLADSASYSRWGIWNRAEVERPGAPDPHGIGAVRALTQGRRTVREEVTRYEPCRVYEYRLISGIPVRNYTARITLDPAAGGRTRIDWRSTYDALPVIGTLVRRKLQSVFADVAHRLADEARRATP